MALSARPNQNDRSTNRARDHRAGQTADDQCGKDDERRIAWREEPEIPWAGKRNQPLANPRLRRLKERPQQEQRKACADAANHRSLGH